MKTALELVQAYNKKKNQVPSVSEQFSPILAQLTTALLQIANREPNIEVKNEIIPSDVKVDAPIVNIPEFPSFPEVKMDFKSLKLPENHDYTSLLIELKRSVDKLTKAIYDRPTNFTVKRNKQGFIEEVNGK